METMKALVKSKRGPGLHLMELPRPEPGHNDVLIRIHKTAICGTDVHIYEWNEWAQQVIPVPMQVGHEFVGVVEETGKTHAQVSLRWLLQRTGVTAPIIGVRTMDHLEQALGATGWELTEMQMAKLNEASEPELVYPWDFVTWAQAGR